VFECSFAEDSGLKCFTVKGRIDALSSAEIHKGFDNLIQAGERVIVVDLTSVDYISSAGLRVFLSVQKKLKTIGGEIVLIKPVSSVLEVFETSGLDQLFRIVSTRDGIIASIGTEEAHPEVISKEVEGIRAEYISLQADKGNLFVIGSQDPLPWAGYTEQDVVTVRPSEMQFGTGLGALGEKFEDCKHLFGESMVINRNLFVYPAVKEPEVDFMMDTDSHGRLTYQFFHGFGFNGSYRYILSFEGKNGDVELAPLVKLLFSISGANVLGISFFAESKGLWGMHLKRVPILEQRPNNGKDIFDPENFSKWFDFPVEPMNVNHIIAGTGIVVKEKSLARPEIQALISEGNDFHIHTGIFEKGPLSKRFEDFEKEFTRIFKELEVYKVQHLLGRSRFGSGMVGIIDLEG
jgi:anti-anti-sigma factor